MRRGGVFFLPWEQPRKKQAQRGFFFGELVVFFGSREKKVLPSLRMNFSHVPPLASPKNPVRWIGSGISGLRISHGWALQYDAEECARDCRTGDGKQDFDVSRGAEADGGDDSRVSGEDEVSRGVGREWGRCGSDRKSAEDGSGAAVVPDDDHGDHQHGASDGDAGDNDLRSDVDGPRDG